MRKTLRDEFRPRIARILAETQGQPRGVVRQRLRDGFPMGVRKYWPYKVWLSEIRRQLGHKRKRHKNGKQVSGIGPPDCFESSPLFDGMD